MEIKLAENAMWGGVIPDVLRNNHISLRFGDELRIDLSSEEFDKLKTLLDQETQKWLNDCRKIVNANDAKDKIFQQYYEKLTREIDNKEWDRIYLTLLYFYNEYWDVKYE
jgi:hypothetical protein